MDLEEICKGLDWIKQRLENLRDGTLGLAWGMSRFSFPFPFFKKIIQTIAIVNLINLIIVFATEPRDDTDPIRSVVSPLSTVLTATSTMRIIISRIGRDGTLNRYRSSVSMSGSGVGRVSIQGNNINTNTNGQTVTKDATRTIPISIVTPLPTPAAKARVRTPPLSRYPCLHDRQQYGHPSNSLTLPTPLHTTHVVSLNKKMRGREEGGIKFAK